MAILGVGLFSVGVSVGGYGAYVTLLISHGVAPDAAGLGMTLFLLGQFLVVLPADRLTRSISVSSVAVIGFMLAGVGAAIGSVPTRDAVFVSRSLLGLGQGTAFIAAMKYVGRRTARVDTATAQGLLGAMFTSGFALGLATTPWILDQFGPAIPALGAAAVAFVGAAGSLSLTEIRTESARSIKTYLRPFVSPTGLALGLGNMATFGFLMVAATWYTDVLATFPSLPTAPTLIGFAVATVVGRLVGGVLSRRIGERATVGASLMALALLLGGIAVSIRLEAGLPLTLALMGTGLCFGVPFGPLFSLAFSELAEDPGVTLVGMLAIGNLGALIYPWLVGRLLADTSSYAAGFAALALTVVVVWTLWHVTAASSESVAASGKASGDCEPRVRR